MQTLLTVEGMTLGGQQTAVYLDAKLIEISQAATRQHVRNSFRKEWKRKKFASKNMPCQYQFIRLPNSQFKLLSTADINMQLAAILLL